MRKLLGSLILLLLLGGALMAYAAEWVGCKYLTAGTGITITCPDTVGRGGATIAGSSSPGGSNTQVQFNDSGAFGGNSSFTYNKTTGVLRVGASYPATAVSLVDGNLVHIPSDTQAGLLIYNANETAGGLIFLTNSNTLNSPASVFSGDALGDILFLGMTDNGAGGVAPSQSLQIEAVVDGTPGVGKVPGRLTFSTMDTSGAFAERMRLTSAGLLSLGSGTTTSPALKGGGAGATLAVRTANDAADAPLSAGSIEVTAGGSTTISTGVGSVKMSTANAATNTSWIPIKYAGNTYYVPGWTTNAP